MGLNGTFLSENNTNNPKLPLKLYFICLVFYWSTNKIWAYSHNLYIYHG
ncbi:hypothetical protein WKT22_00022 [Candidatus Lokiarchaeum ossiferum]